MPQIGKGGKFVFGKSLVRDDMSIHLPSQAACEYSIASEGKVYLISGSKRSGGFVVTRKGLLYPSRIGNILKEIPELSEYRLGQGLLMRTFNVYSA